MIYINYFYVDESGSMTTYKLSSKTNCYFVICIINVFNIKRLKKVFKRFISSHIEELKLIDKKNKMFSKNGKFKELKGCALNRDMKLKLANYLCQNNLFQIFYICVNNVGISDIFYNNKARAFNYLIKLLFESNTNMGNIPKANNYLFIDERNVKTGTRASLCEYLNTELVIANNIQKSFVVNYYDSEDNIIIQIADFFSNLYYSYILCGDTYNDVIDNLRNKKYIINEFIFPNCY